MTMHADLDKRGLEAAARKIITVMQLQDFGHEDPEGNFHTTGQKIDKLEQSAAIAAEAAIRAYLSTATPDGWRPIETAPKIEFARYIGWDTETACIYDDNPLSGLCIITWLDGYGEDDPGCWQVQPFAEGMDCTEPSNLTHWLPFDAVFVAPSPPLQQEGQSNG